MTNVGGSHKYLRGTIQEHDEHLHQIYGFDILIISGSYGGHRRHTMDVRRQTPGVWHSYLHSYMTYDRQRHGYGISSPQVS